MKWKPAHLEPDQTEQAALEKIRNLRRQGQKGITNSGAADSRHHTKLPFAR
jgi:hypothetical protein